MVATACPVYIHVTDINGKAASNVVVTIDHIVKGNTDASGILMIELDSGEHILHFRKGAILLKQVNINIDCIKENRFDFELKEQGDNSITLQQVTVKALTAKEQLGQSPFSVQAIDLKKSYDKGGDIGEILNRASGVRLRSDGGVGAPVQINLGGLQGKAVRLFKDGIPIELFGHGFSLGTIPVNMLERVEIYKGAMPLYLASDALGGGVNLVSRHDYKNLAELSYEAGSFNTHRVTANGLWRNGIKTWYLGTSSSLNYSDNDYKVNVPISTNPTTYQDTKRFHDATRSYYAEIYTGIQNRTWTDDLRLTLIASSFYKEIQHDAQMDKAYGEPYSKERNYTSLLTYKKFLLNNRMKVNAVGTYSYFKTRFIDTATVRYGWDGQIIGSNLKPGEINMGNNQLINYKFFSSRLNLTYELSDRHVLDFSELYYQQRRIGSDPLGAISAIEAIDVLSVPALYRKDNTALGLRSNWLGKEMESIIALKYYHFQTEGYTTDNFGMGYRSSGTGQQLGYLGGLRWNHGKYLFKASYEYATRLPDEYEIFGDARLIKENMNLKPEKSHNVNLNGQYTVENGEQSLTLSAGLFYRKVQDIIFLQLDIPFSRYINYERAQVKGFELEANYVPVRRFNIGMNVTYQDIRRIGIKEAMFRNLENSRVPNVPYFFGNFWLNAYFWNVLHKGDRLELSWNGNYTHRFFLQAIPKNQEPGLFEKVKNIQTSLIIPRDDRLGQLANNVGIYYHFAKPKLTLSGECRNIGDVRLYDNFNVQKPGRAFYLKVLYQFF
ncbi:TonB-dependent receptor [Pedobacter chinensis]|uniref:TonB-dependent receptor n=2 Tax=Pedobacter chinensis TaxID=2282421 RepID=A0A369PU47_9SPHI|nr:TonB-dependent receptor [Pedobacter chinensis]